ncbi:hypothetical protein EV562_101545 [Streptomyces sp. BK208]|uniref:DUF6895 family protein n=1 Tax=Streptomyces sp. BK208 TaxID=2512150 RepID=UPI0010E529E4|nr:hypothetical protein [Streptomyces sp. BK208]TDT42575.1 hypothetical protein EV562_101545 [Streptomyces sp. BK208]
MTSLDESVVLAMADRAVTWLHTHLPHASMPPDVSADLVDSINDYKALGELAVMASVIIHALPDAMHQRARDVLDFSWKELHGGGLLYERQLRHPTLTDPVESYAPFASAGFHHAALEELLRHVHGLVAFKGTELYPNRRLGVANAQRLAGLPHPDNWQDLAAATWLGHLPEPWAIDWDDAYCVTHTVFHLADWGRRPLELPAPAIVYLERWLPVWLDAWSETQEWDLVGELLIVDLCLPHPLFPPEFWLLIADAQHVSGFVARKGTAEPTPQADPASEFRRHQHTTCVVAIAAALAASRLRDV